MLPLLHNFWSETKATDTAAGRILKRNLVKILDDKIWKDIVALHVVETWLDPTLIQKSFSFVSNSEERKAILQQAEKVVEGHAVVAAGDLYTAEDNREGNAEDYEYDVEEVAEEQHAKRCKHDSLLEF